MTCGITSPWRLEDRHTWQVIDTEGNVMTGLYAAGELVGGLFYHNYAGGSGLPPVRYLAAGRQQCR